LQIIILNIYSHI